MRYCIIIALLVIIVCGGYSDFVVIENQKKSINKLKVVVRCGMKDSIIFTCRKCGQYHELTQERIYAKNN